MASIKIEEIKKMGKNERDKKLDELKMELIKSKAGASKTGSSKSREIRKIIARIHTFNTSENKKWVLKKE